MIPENVALRLGIDTDKIKQKVEMMLADGRRRKAKIVIIDSVKTGGAEAKNVEAAIIKSRASQHTDALLGMSFLKNFLFSIDTENNKLNLNYFE